ncbi:MAG: exosome nuclease subunit [Cirrosporium novae-zelandiae]|nr:MAG: exosome nuclease subunit [Cirrosporium novae-zelandiae]
MDPTKDFSSFQRDVTSTLVSTTKTVGQISVQDLSFQTSINPSLSKSLDNQRTRLLGLAEKLLKTATSGSGVDAQPLEDADAVEDNWRGVVDIIDNLLEKVDSCLDEYTGVIKRLSPAGQTQSSGASTERTHSRPKFGQSKNIPKPQLLFNKVPTNDEVTTFKPLLTSKPHAIEPLDESLKTFVDEDGQEAYDISFYHLVKDPQQFQHQIDTTFRYKNPYETEIDRYKYPKFVYERKEPIPYLPFESTAATFVDTPEAVTAMLAELKEAKEIAVDLEHHDQRSYIGIVSLMQISTRDKDWIIDTLKPWREDLQALNEVFADPNILKVFHGSHMDMIWLQRDLGHLKHSLAALLERYVHIIADKQYQLADWRTRPLSDVMMKYARSDTHYLLYIYDRLRNDLIEQSNPSLPDGDLIDQILDNSKKEALQRYERPFYDDARGSGRFGWYNLLTRSSAIFTKEQFSVFRAVHRWRDTVARKEDDSIYYVMANKTIYNLARAMPIDVSSVIAACNPITPAIERRFSELAKLIKKAKDAGKDGPEFRDVIRPWKTSAEIPQTLVQSQETSEPVQANIKMVSCTPASALAARSSESRFWGGTLANNPAHEIWRGFDTVPEALRLALPLPQLASGEPIIQSIAAERLPASAETNSEPEPSSGRKREREEVIVLNASKKRMAPASEDDQIGDASSNTSSPVDKNKKTSKRIARKQAKEARRLANMMNNLENNREDGDQEAFDYENATSVLHAKTSNKAASTTQPKAFNPYAKAMEAPAGAKKTHREQTGRSFTFKR